MNTQKFTCFNFPSPLSGFHDFSKKIPDAPPPGPFAAPAAEPVLEVGVPAEASGGLREDAAFAGVRRSVGFRSHRILGALAGATLAVGALANCVGKQDLNFSDTTGHGGTGGAAATFDAGGANVGGTGTGGVNAGGAGPGGADTGGKDAGPQDAADLDVDVPDTSVEDASPQDAATPQDIFAPCIAYAQDYGINGPTQMGVISDLNAECTVAQVVDPNGNVTANSAGLNASPPSCDGQNQFAGSVSAGGMFVTLEHTSPPPQTVRFLTIIPAAAQRAYCTDGGNISSGNPPTPASIDNLRNQVLAQANAGALPPTPITSIVSQGSGKFITYTVPGDSAFCVITVAFDTKNCPTP